MTTCSHVANFSHITVMRSNRHNILGPLLLLASALCPPLHAQRGSANLSEGEIESIRESAMSPAERVAVFQKIIDTRIERIQRVLVDVRAQGRAEDIHQYLDEIAGVVNEAEDNLDEYAAGHKDLRKPLPKLVAATERWTSILKQPPENDQYKVARQLALEAVADLKDQAAKLLPEQQKYFKEHPPSKDPEPKQYEVSH